ncbi:hypothetical protein PG995_011442 [Apiospora arundinis]
MTRTSDDSIPAWDVCSFLRTVEREAGSRLKRLCVDPMLKPGSLAPGLLSMCDYPQLRELALALEIFRCHMSNTAQNVGKDIGELNDEDAGALDLIPVLGTHLTLLSEGCLEHVKVLQVLFHDFDNLKATRLPSLEQIVLHCEENYDSETHPDSAYRAKCESLVLELEPTGVTLQVEEDPLDPYEEWPGAEKFEEYPTYLRELHEQGLATD